MYSVQPTRRYERSLKRLIKSGRFSIVDVDVVINTLRTDKTLNAQYRNHPLHGEYAGCFECHIKGGILFVYEIDEVEKIIRMMDIGSHSDLFG
ncbi:MAG: hypothetical protein A3C08_02435 [Candidatus Taylorbacteria bacterium RIFCSPHIGHO2_02_FULL_47_18]|uniref:Addiction module toxin RelE n=1 Tax=Candidatus Taylorbacteria bacterium RIFCSPLOWO2_01_FULL_48_100 TaxID=1802322 RepID=A0A1G2NFZ8_9BACT|nr:MAG: hypothetical protein A3C08_02435 [Candidatus Taylorbacteria bacterium RIFCSPHIGHO2_02_FULL_47_18]OHA35010.1 MAG: hypothetical protein A2938_01420 [Candidatus Taylorbacteria bacterium RIFCSPLOWO2_01_FULL_48_100]OHA40955.1 MAG: hypothetical protein A3J31_00095 [Candidatus Taylorbacteria bacterium RIFCSPLOWO2_02_FULL_48_16]